MKKVLLSLSLTLSFAISEAQTAFEIIQNSPNHNTLEAAILAAGLDDELNTLNPITVFAPTDAAFNLLPAGAVDAFLANVPELTDLLFSHIVNGTFLSPDIIDGQVETSLNGTDITFSVSGNGVVVNQISQVIVADIVATNGVVHVTDALIIPGIMANTMWEYIQTCPVLNTLEEAVLVAGLEEMLQNDYFFTMFAPTDDAFSFVPPATLQFLMSNPTIMRHHLLYHLTNGVIPSTELTDGQVLPMIEGGNAQISISLPWIDIDFSYITYPDLNTWNGVIHLISDMLIPTSVDEILKTSFQAYPNPCADVLIIERNSASAENFSIYNFSGQLVESGLLNNTLNTISTNTLTPGMYSLVTKSGGHFNFIKN